MRRFLVPGLISCAAIAFLAVIAFGVATNATNNTIENEVARHDYPVAPDSTNPLPVLGSSRQLQLSSFKGKVVLVNVFASWCTPCQTEAPAVEQAQRMLERAGGTVVGITYEDNAVADQAFVRQYHLTYPVLRDVNGDFAHSLGLTGVPDSFVINRAGRIQAFQLEPLTTQWLQQTLPKILAEPA